MNVSKLLRPRLLVMLALLASSAWFSVGCTTTHPDDTSMPWTRQQEWENQGPGMPGR